MSLKSLCMQQLAKNICEMPPLLKDEVIEASTREIERKTAETCFKNFNHNMPIIIDIITPLILESNKTGNPWKKPEGLDDVPNDIFQLCVVMCETVLEHALSNSQRPTGCFSYVLDNYDEDDEDDY